MIYLIGYINGCCLESTRQGVPKISIHPGRRMGAFLCGEWVCFVFHLFCRKACHEIGSLLINYSLNLINHDDSCCCFLSRSLEHPRSSWLARPMLCIVVRFTELWYTFLVSWTGSFVIFCNQTWAHLAYLAKAFQSSPRAGQAFDFAGRACRGKAFLPCTAFIRSYVKRFF